MALLASNVDLDLSQLTEDERSLVLEVVRRDRDLRQNELDYIERLQSDVDKLKELSVPENEDKCVRCGVEFWWLFRRSEICETCRRKVCEKCRRPVKDAKANQCWLCVLCYKERELRALTGAWFYQSLKFRRSKRQRKSLRSKPPSAYYPEVSTPPPVEYFYYFNFNDSVAAAKDEVGTDDVDSIWKGSRQLTLDNDSDTLSDISEESETETEESFSVMVDFNGRYNRATRAGLRSDVDKNFAEVAEHNRKLLLQGRRRKVVENPQTFAKIFAEQIVGDMVQMKKDYVQIHLAANGLTPANGNSPQTGRNDMDFDNNDGKSSRNGPALNRRDGSSKAKDEYAPGRRDNEGSTTVHGNGLDIDQKRSSLYVPRAVNGQAQKPKKSVTISSGEPTIAPDPYNIRNQYTSSTSAAPPSNLASCVKVEESPLYSRNIKATMEIPSTPVVVAAVDHDIGMVDDSGPMQSSFKVGENAGVVHDSRVTSSLPPVDLNISQTITTSDASVTNQTHATVHEPHLLKSDSPIVPAQVAAKVNTRELSASEEQSTQVNSDPAVSELRQVPVAVDSIALETVSVSNVENSSSPFDVNIEEDLMVRSDSPDVRVTETATILAAGAQFADDRSELADDILVQSFDATYIALLPTDHSDFVTKLFDNTSASGDSVIGFQSFDVTSTSPATGDTEVSLELGSEALETENQMPSTDSVFMSPNSASNMQTGYSFELYPQSSLELSTDERGDDLDEAFHSQSSRQTVSLSTEDDHQRIRSTSGMSEKMSWMSDSRDSLSSDLSTATNVKVSGDICLEITYDNRLRVLELRIIECRNLAPIGKTQYANAYVKAYIMPDKNRAGKKKTKVVKKSLNPKFDERMVYDVARAELDDCALWLSVWHSGNFGKNVFLGDVLIPLESYNVDQRQPRWLHLVQQGREKWKSMASLPMKLSPCVKLSLKYVAADSNKSRKTKSTKGELHVSVKEAHGLMSIKNSGVPHAFCKLCLLPEKQSRQHGRHKTATAKRESDPVWNQTFVFPDVNLDDLMSSRSLEITVWDQERLASKSLLGKVVLGSGRDASGQNEDTNMWQSMLNNANEWVEGSVVLQLL